MRLRRCLLALTLYLSACGTTAAPLPLVTVSPPARDERTLYESDVPSRGRLQARFDLAGRGLLSDPRLSELAAFVNDYWRRHGEAPGHQVVDFVAHHLGLPEPAPHLAMLAAPAQEMDAHILRELEELSRRGTYTHVGLDEATDGPTGRAVLVLSFRRFSMAPLPRSVPAGTPIHLHGALAEGYRSPTLVVVQPGGNTERRPLGQGPVFDTELRAEGEGELRVELLADGPLGTTVMANFPVFVGVKAPDSIRVAAEPSEEASVEDAPASLLNRLNASRAQMGRPALARDAALDVVAAGHNADMLAHDFVGHESPNTGSAVDRVTRAGLPTSLVLENIGRDSNAAAIHAGWMGSPGHRENILHPQATHVGIAVSSVPAEDDGKPTLLATEVFIRRTPALGGDAVQTLLDAINRMRSAAGAPPLRLDPTLSDLCQAAALRYFGEPQTPVSRTLSDLQRDLRDAGTAHERVATTLIVTSVLEEIAREPQLAVPDAKAIGLGIAQGTRTPGEPNAIAVVLSLAY